MMTDSELSLEVYLEVQYCYVFLFTFSLFLYLSNTSFTTLITLNVNFLYLRDFLDDSDPCNFCVDSGSCYIKRTGPGGM